jgi:homoserine/homoserine lactone efflux protein
MAPLDFATYLLVLASLSLAPGPFMAIVAARALARDLAGASALTLGVGMGNLVMIGMIYAGLGVWIEQAPEMFEMIKYAGLTYLLWMALQMWRTADKVESGVKSVKEGTVSASIFGFCTCFVSPHYVLLYLLFLPQILDITSINMSVLSVFGAGTFVVILLCYGGVAMISAKLSARTHSSKHSAAITKCLATVIAGSGVWMVAA